MAALAALVRSTINASRAQVEHSAGCACANAGSILLFLYALLYCLLTADLLARSPPLSTTLKAHEAVGHAVVADVLVFSNCNVIYTFCWVDL